ncbi:hypothetical protein C5Y96_10395 [Blastopirellula marina]|uniref:Xylose isomerase-like TIM barrel domain-containing protein n=1 Tax=Blastopirellula marina TaxID=124 RepID=A0A2S8FN20_9BACT|nr:MULTISPECIES: TIM barrel protein [Pirellulaceae]PQO33254.1 hypothetical protein C5Y96_10395 [Blastopirellula marina]RCS52343.1 hypothetical protein DTL36_10405 [Bremerella cremea]
MKSHPLLVLLAFLFCVPMVRAAEPTVLRQDNLVAWCIVPFDAAKRTPEQRAAMLKDLGIKRCAYDWRAEHVPTFEDEIKAYQKEGIEFFAFWRTHDKALELFKKYDLQPQIWDMIPQPNADTQEAKVEQAASSMKAIAEQTKGAGLPLGLYNHGGWGGEPQNMVAVCQKLHAMGYDHVGIVYNFHHGHDHIADWPEIFAQMKPYLICLNVNGMNDNAQPKILGIGKGKHERAMIETIVASDYDGPIGILDHRNELDAKESLQENLTGLATVRKELASETK